VAGWGCSVILTIPYKPLTRCGLEELEAQQRFNERSGRCSGGVAFARKDNNEDCPEKDAARSAILSLLTLDKMPERVSVLSMPGLSWRFESALLKQRDQNWRLKETTEKVDLMCVENDRFIYYSAATKMPGNVGRLVRSLPRPIFAERAIGNGIVSRYALANVDDLMAEGQEAFDVAWLDYTGPLSLARMKLIQGFFKSSVRRVLIVTALKARWNAETSRVITRHGGCLAWMQARLRAQVLHAIEYQDGLSPMVQIAVSAP
jgi:hypothetical protein